MLAGILSCMGLLPDKQYCGCVCAGNAGNAFPVTAGKRSRHASRHVRHARAVMHDGIANVPGIPGACATCNFTYLVRGPWRRIYLKVDSHLLCTQWYITKRHVCNIKLERVETASMGYGNTKYIVSQRLFESKLIWKNMRKIYKNPNEQKKIPLHRT